MTILRFGYACINTGLSEEEPCVSLNRTCRLKNANKENLSLIAEKKSADLIKILRWNEGNGIKFFRISSEIFPFMDHPDQGYNLNWLNTSEKIKNNLAEAGLFAYKHNHKLESHPSPYCCLGSPNEKVVYKSILCLEMHNLILELLGMNFNHKINIHIGGIYGNDFSGTAKRFSTNFFKLSKNLCKRLTLENDDKSSMWSINSLYKWIHLSIGIPITFDYHHWIFCH